jgi:hemolysin III
MSAETTRVTGGSVPTAEYTPAEELANCASHGLGVVLSVVASLVLVTRSAAAEDPLRVAAFAVYGASLVLLYAASTAYHAAKSKKKRRRLRVLDHAAIFLLIAGTYTPVTLITLTGVWGWRLFALVWSLALVGVVSKLFFVGTHKGFTALIYVVMGWLVLFAAKPLYAAMPAGGIFWLLAGGGAYTGGTVFYAWKRLPFNHAIWHLFVLAGSACHFVCMLLYVLPRGR